MCDLKASPQMSSSSIGGAWAYSSFTGELILSSCYSKSPKSPKSSSFFSDVSEVSWKSPKSPNPSLADCLLESSCWLKAGPKLGTGTFRDSDSAADAVIGASDYTGITLLALSRAGEVGG